MKNGLYRYNQKGGMLLDTGTITVNLKETKKTINLHLVENSCRYSPAHIDMLFAKKDKISIKKQDGSHAVFLYDNYFVIYPYRAGIPFLFEYV